MTPLRILLDAVRRGHGTTGTDRVARNVLRELQRLDHTNRFVVRRAEWDTELGEVVGAPNFSLEDVPGGRRRELPGRKRPPGADVAYSFRNLHVPSAAGRTVVAVHDLAPVATAYYHPDRWRRALARRRAERAIERADRFVAVSEFSKRELVARYGVAEDAVVVAPNAADPVFRPLAGADAAAARARLRLPDRFLLTLGGADPRKNVVGVLAAQARLRVRLPVVVVGSRWHGRDLEVTGGTDVRVVGPVPDTDLAALYALADIFVFLSLYEGFGLPVLEAMACGTPVVCSHSSALPEVAGDAGMLVDPLDDRAVAQELDALIADPDRRTLLAAQGRERAAAFTWDGSARTLLAALTER